MSDASPPHRPLRVLQVITRMIVGGAQEQAMLTCALLDERRFEASLLTGPETGSEGELHTEARARGVALSIEPSLVRRVHPWKDAVALVRLVLAIRRGRYDVVHTHSSKAGILGRCAAYLAGTPIRVHTVHGWGFNRRQSPAVFGLYLVLERFCARLCDRLVVVGTPNQVEGLSLRIGRPEQYRLIRSGIEIEQYREVTLSRGEARARIGLPERAFVVGTVGRLGPQKAPLDMLSGFVHLASAHPEARLVFVGDGPQRAEVETAIARSGLGDRVHLLGLRRDVPELLRAFDVFALASHWEGLPRVFPQAMAAGLPIVATCVDGAPDAVTPGENGWLVEVGDTAGLGQRLIELARDPELARRMGECGRSRVDEFSATRMVKACEGLYEELARAKGLLE